LPTSTSTVASEDAAQKNRIKIVDLNAAWGDRCDQHRIRRIIPIPVPLDAERVALVVADGHV
jgi:hypothetical protein